MRCDTKFIFAQIATIHSLFGQNPSSFSVPVIVQLDGVALEPAEGFALSLAPTNVNAVDVLAEGMPGLIAHPDQTCHQQEFIKPVKPGSRAA